MLDNRILERLFRQNYSEMIHLASVLLGDVEEAEDVVQDVFLRLASGDRWRGFEIPDSVDADFKSASALGSVSARGSASVWESASARGYLLTAVRNASLNRIRHLRVRDRVKGLLPVDDEADLQPVDKRLERLEAITAYVDGQLEEPHRSIFHLRFDDDLTVGETARRLGLNPNTAYKYLMQSIEQIRQHFKTY
ncbi:MAG: sigma-70 family RNA polymerase sigma factor [Prevotella sp.]|nr:sigma-70 family RNA polymerase sigma factor [Prevotella sp.]